MEKCRTIPITGNPPDPEISKALLYSPDREPTLLASLPAPPRQPRSRRQGVSDLQMKKELLAALLGKPSRFDRPQDLTLVRSRLGKVYLLIDGAPGPAVSFSWSPEKLWAALGTRRSWIGLDAASPGEFDGAYPLPRVFATAEWQAATCLTGGSREEAAALLWSVKEAVVKARGCGYHFFGPRQVRVEFAGLGSHGPRWLVHLEGSCPDQVPADSPGILPVSSVRLHNVWLSVAWMIVNHGNTSSLAG